jgi:hypothetical protein
MPETRFPGKVINLGGVDYVVPAIALGALKLLAPRLATLDLGATGMPTAEDLDTIVDMTLAALNRNYPEMKRKELEDLIDLGNLKEIVDVVAGQSALVARGKAAEQTSP